MGCFPETTTHIRVERILKVGNQRNSLSAKPVLSQFNQARVDEELGIVVSSDINKVDARMPPREAKIVSQKHRLFLQNFINLYVKHTLE
jgi:hypothetical protein